jgi:hypothetical protein
VAREQHDNKTEREKLEQALTIFTALKMPCEIKDVQNCLNETNRNDLGTRSSSAATISLFSTT